MAINLGMTAPSAEAIAQARALYTQNLGREGDEAGIQGWAQKIASGDTGNLTNDFRNAARQVYEQFAATGQHAQGDLLARDFNNPGQIGGGSARAGLATQPKEFVYGKDEPQKPLFNPAATTFGNPFEYNQKNPYLDEMSKVITGQVNDNLTRKVLPGIASGAMQAGGFGGSRQGVVEANALNDANRGLSDALTNMRFGDYNNTMGRQLQKYGMDQGYNLGLGSLQLGNRNADMNQVQLGANLFQQSNQGMLSQGQGIYNLGLTGQQAPWQAMQNFGGVATPYTGFGSTSSSGSTEGSKGAGFLGGALAGSQAYNIFSGGGSNNPMGVQNTNGFTNTPNYLRFDL